MSMNLTGAVNCRVDVAQYYNGTTFDIPASTGAMTICAWIKATSLGAAQRVLVKSSSNSGANTTLYGISITEISGVKRLRCYLTTGTSDTTLDGATTTIATGTVYFICVWYDGTNFRSYINAVQEATTAKTGNVAINSTMPLYIGDNPNVRINFNGIIDDVRIYTRALTVNEMKTIYYGAGRDNIVNGLYANWKFREKNFGARFSLPNTLIDYSSIKKHATSEDAGYELNFTNANSHRVTLASVNSDFQLVAPFTIEAWIKPTALTGGTFYRIFGTRNGSTNGIAFGSVGLKPTLWTGTPGDYTCVSDRLTASVWQHIAVVFQAGGIAGRSALFYVNGSLVETITKNLVGDSGTSLSGAEIGSVGSNGEYWDGSIDLVKVYKGEARSAAHISLYKDEHPPNSTNLKGYWKMNEGSGTSVTDVSGNSHTGTLAGVTGLPVWGESTAWAIPLCDNILSHKRT